MAGIKFPKPKATKRDPRKAMKEKAASAFQRWVCLRDCNNYNPNALFAKCISCPEIRHFKGLQGGHFIDGRGQSLLFDEHNCHAQCALCNGHISTEFLKRDKDSVDAAYRIAMVEKYGLEEVERLESLKMIPKDYSFSDLESIYRDYTGRLKEAGLA